MAQKGYLVLAMDMRKGWDIKGITNMQATQELLAYWFHNYCDCEGSCDSYSILESNYRNLQDLLAVYGYLLNNKSTLNINTNGISFILDCLLDLELTTIHYWKFRNQIIRHQKFHYLKNLEVHFVISTTIVPFIKWKK